MERLAVMELSAKLVRLGLGDVARDVCGGAELHQLEQAGPVRSAFVARLVADGWAAANVQRLLGEPVSGGARPTSCAQGAEREPGRSSGTGHAPASPLGGAGGTVVAEGPPRVRRLRPVRREVPPPPPSSTQRSAVSRLPLTPYDELPRHERPRMLVGEGARPDCVHEADCLGRALQPYGRKPGPAAMHCSPACRYVEAPSFDQRIAQIPQGRDA